MKTVLALDTSGPSLSVALLSCGIIRYERTQHNGLTHSDSLMPLVDEALCTVGMKPADVDCFAVVHGPGSFTGVRIGVATAKALAHATGKSCMPVSALEALAAGLPGYAGLTCALQDARAGQVYCAAFRQGEQILPDAAIKLVDFIASLKQEAQCAFVGDGAVAHRQVIEEALGARAYFPPANHMMVRASAVAILAAEREAEWQSWQALMPYYLRAPQAERERLAREGKQGG